MKVYNESLKRTGKDGKDGVDGNDGRSITHEWDGTVLKVTSASGTTSSDLKGEKGDKGETGEKGDTGAAGAVGKNGTDGKSAYSYAQDGGYAGNEEEFIEKLAGEYSTPNLAVNDETDPAYVKGRTHWTEKTEVELLAEETYEVSDSEISLATVPYLIAGDTYFVTWNGTKYECVAQEGRWSDIPCVTLGNVDENDEGEPFVLFVNPEFMARSSLFTVICKVLDGSSTVTMSISHLKEVVHTIDPKYIEDMYHTSVEEVVGEILPETEFTSVNN